MGPWGRLLKKLPGDLFSPESFCLIEIIVFFVRHVFTPYGIRMYARSRDGDVGEPTVFPCAVPVLDIILAMAFNIQKLCSRIANGRFGKALFELKAA